MTAAPDIEARVFLTNYRPHRRGETLTLRTVEQWRRAFGDRYLTVTAPQGASHLATLGIVPPSAQELEVEQRGRARQAEGINLLKRILDRNAVSWVAQQLGVPMAHVIAVTRRDMAVDEALLVKLRALAARAARR
jgi:hypothetical protein